MGHKTIFQTISQVLKTVLIFIKVVIISYSFTAFILLIVKDM